MTHKNPKFAVAFLLLLAGCPGWLEAARRAKAPRASRANPAAAAREALNEGRLSEALVAYKRVIDRRDDPALRCEYAFVLAKLGMGDAALEQLDQAFKAKRFPGTGAWFRARILLAAGAQAAADELGRDAEAPDWLNNQELDDFSRPEKNGDLKIRFVNANRLAAQDQHHLAVAEFSSALQKRPNDTVGWIGLSLPLEKLGAMDSARAALDKAAPLAEKSPELKNLVKNRRAQLGEGGTEKLSRREAKLRKQKQSAADRQSRVLLFGGGSFGNSGSSALSGRFGYFVTPSLDAAVDLSFSNLGQSSATGTSSQLGLGVSTRYYWPMGEKGGAFALGARIGYQAEQTMVTLSPGFTSPTGDFFIDITVHSGGFQIGLTVGATSYFGGGK